MKLFGKKEKNNIENSSEIKEQIEREVIVHNMPHQEKFVGEIINPHSAGKISLNDNNHHEVKKDFKIIGILIIFFGFIIIGAIVFFIYKYVIAPTANNNYQIEESKKELVVEIPKDNIQPTESKTSIEIPDSHVDIDQVVVDEDIQVEDEKNDLMPEEFPGLDAKDLPPLVDSDNDGLFDEEELILGTSVFSDDSDDDGYKDLEEIKSNYNPNGSGVLSESLFIKKYQNDNFNFQIIHPSSLNASLVGDNLIVFEFDDGSLIQLSITENYDNSSILNWYQNNFSGETISYNKLISKSGYEGVVSQNNLNIYITQENRKNVFIFSYIPVSAERLSFINIFEMIYSSFGNAVIPRYNPFKKFL